MEVGIDESNALPK